MEVLRQKCDKVGVSIGSRQMVLKITETKKCTLLTSVDNKVYSKLPNYYLNTVMKFWANKYKTHNTYN